MQLVKFEGQDNPVFINPEHVVAVEKGLRDTRIVTTAGSYAVKEDPAVVVRLLGGDEVPKDITPMLSFSRTI